MDIAEGKVLVIPEHEYETESGLVLPEHIEDNSQSLQTGEVWSVGPGEWQVHKFLHPHRFWACSHPADAGIRNYPHRCWRLVQRPSVVEVGDRVLFGRFSGTPFKHEAIDGVVLWYDEVIAIVRSEALVMGSMPRG